VSAADDRLEELRRRDDERLERLDSRDRAGEKAPVSAALFGGGDWFDDEPAPAVRRSELRPALHGSTRHRRRWERRAKRNARRRRRRERRALQREESDRAA
jgi:hypothetical protein